MITVRRYQLADIPEIASVLETALKPFRYGKMMFAPQKVRYLLQANIYNPGFFCHIVIEDGEVVGGMCGEVVEYPFSYEAYAQDYVTLIAEGHRSVTAITSLVTAYKEWAISRGVREIRWSQSSGYKMDKFKALAKRLGFTQIGACFTMEVGK